VANRTVSPVLPCTPVRPSNLAQRLVCAGVLTFALATPDAAAKREKIRQVTPAKRSRPARPADLSRGGERRGGIEFALGSVTAALTGVLIGRGIWELVIADRAAKKCANGGTDPSCPPDLIDPKPGRGGRISGGLSLGFALPVAIASGFLFRYAVRIRRDFKRFEREHPGAARDVALSPWLGRTGGGVALRLRF
jgi:hypothetical protein